MRFIRQLLSYIQRAVSVAERHRGKKGRQTGMNIPDKEHSRGERRGERRRRH